MNPEQLFAGDRSSVSEQGCVLRGRAAQRGGVRHRLRDLQAPGPAKLH